MSDSEPSVPHGYCRCGCGGKTAIARRNRAEWGHVKGEPVPFISGHNGQKYRPPPGTPRTKLCDCGCGRPAPIAKTTRAADGIYLGYPMRYISGHQGRRQQIVAWHEEDRGYTSSCWIWDQYRDSAGYGRIGGSDTSGPAHRAVYEERVGPIPDGLQLDHLCQVRECVNPDHLEPVTHTENVRRSRRAKLTLEGARSIRVEVANGTPRRELARRFGVSVGCIAAVVNGETWRET